MPPGTDHLQKKKKKKTNSSDDQKKKKKDILPFYAKCVSSQSYSVSLFGFYIHYKWLPRWLPFAIAGGIRDTVESLGWEDPLEEEMATPSSILAWRTPWTEEPGGQQSIGSQRVDTTEVT